MNGGRGGGGASAVDAFITISVCYLCNFFLVKLHPYQKKIEWINFYAIEPIAIN